ncbi:hypothetical protein MKOR_14140 [Mycolicibacillus koreensis]|nr:hypothetical protein MKOR_14140 [Mycolicibacillus koreensis]
MTPTTTAKDAQLWSTRNIYPSAQCGWRFSAAGTDAENDDDDEVVCGLGAGSAATAAPRPLAASDAA